MADIEEECLDHSEGTVFFDSVVDDFFSFLNEEFEVELSGDVIEQEDDPSKFRKTVEQVLDEEFSFLKDEITDDILEQSPSSKSQNSDPFSFPHSAISSHDDSDVHNEEPIYSNVKSKACTLYCPAEKVDVSLNAVPLFNNAETQPRGGSEFNNLHLPKSSASITPTAPDDTVTSTGSNKKSLVYINGGNYNEHNKGTSPLLLRVSSGFSDEDGRGIEKELKNSTGKGVDLENLEMQIDMKRVDDTPSESENKLDEDPKCLKQSGSNELSIEEIWMEKENLCVDDLQQNNIEVLRSDEGALKIIQDAESNPNATTNQCSSDVGHLESALLSEKNPNVLVDSEDSNLFQSNVSKDYAYVKNIKEKYENFKYPSEDQPLYEMEAKIVPIPKIKQVKSDNSTFVKESSAKLEDNDIVEAINTEVLPHSEPFPVLSLGMENLPTFSTETELECDRPKDFLPDNSVSDDLHPEVHSKSRENSSSGVESVLYALRRSLRRFHHPRLSGRRYSRRASSSSLPHTSDTSNDGNKISEEFPVSRDFNRPVSSLRASLTSSEISRNNSNSNASLIPNEYGVDNRRRRSRSIPRSTELRGFDHLENSGSSSPIPSSPEQRELPSGNERHFNENQPNYNRRSTRRNRESVAGVSDQRRPLYGTNAPAPSGRGASNPNCDNINQRQNSNSDTRRLNEERTASARTAHPREGGGNSSRHLPQRLLTPSRSQSRESRSSISKGFVPPKRGLWPHNHSGLMASLAVTVTLFNISRFAVLGAHFGWQFPIQWLVISLALGLPLMTFHASLGQYIGGTVVDMWVISPIFQGIGYSLLLAEAVLGIYCCVPIAWLFKYFRDSFNPGLFACIHPSECDSPRNSSMSINHIMPAYFTSAIHEDKNTTGSFLASLGSLKFDLSFNVALLWAITFIALSRGSRSYGKICYIIFLIPFLSYLIVCGNFIYWIVQEIDITKLPFEFLDRYAWMAASREAFLVWGLHGCVIQQIAANNKRHHRLWRDTTIVACITILSLGLASFCGSLSYSFLKGKKLVYEASSFENVKTRRFIDVHLTEKDSTTIFQEKEELLSRENELSSLESFPYDNFYVGIRIKKKFVKDQLYKNNMKERSGYNVLQFPLELFPAVIFLKDNRTVSLWPPLFYIALLLFGIAQQLAVWQFVIQGVIRINYERLQSWEIFIAFCCCLFGFSCTLLMVTRVGIQIVYFLDYLIGCAWWIMILQLIQVFAVFFVRGKPCSAQDIAKRFTHKGNGCSTCCSCSWCSTPVTLAWTIMIPVGLLVLSISSFKTGNYREIYAWDYSDYWPVWVCQLASALQLIFLLIVPLVGLIQTCRYLSDPRQDLFVRLKHLYRPPKYKESEDISLSSIVERNIEMDDVATFHLPYSRSNPLPSQTQNQETDADQSFIDPPPKYTPPPSYSAATGSRYSIC